MRSLHILAAVALALAPANVTAQLAVLAPRSPTPEEQRNFIAADEAVNRWGRAIKARHRLDQVGCSALNGVSCNFSMDGVTLMLARPSRKSAELQAHLSLGNRIQVAGDRIQVVSGKWIKPGDVFELEASSKVFPYICLPAGEGENTFAQCRVAWSLAELDGLGARSEAHYVFASNGLQLGRAITGGDLTVRHNGRVLQWANLINAAREFAGQDFSKVIRN